MTTTSTSDTRSPTGPTVAAIDIRDLHKTFPAPRGAAGPVEAVRGVDLTIRPGEIVALLGPNGAGKTTLLDMVLGFTEPTSGCVSVLGGRPADAIAAGSISSVMQTGGLLPRITVGETLQMIADLHGRTGDIEAVAERAGLTQVMSTRVSRCSGGEQQRLRFALALLPDPDLLLLDEPTTGLDVAARRDFWTAIRQDAARGLTIVFATHYLAEADDIADRIVLMSAGRVVADGTPAQVKGRALGRRIRAVLPDPGLDDHLRAHPATRTFERHGDTVVLARDLIMTTAATDIEITSNALEDAFVTLTRENR